MCMDEDVRRKIALDRKRRLSLPYRELEYRPASERIRDFHEVVIPFDAESAMAEAARCLQCPEISSCMKGCPAQNNIPKAMSYIEKGDFIEAAQVFRQTSSFPEICGRVCPQEFLCEGSCSLKRQGKGVHIGALEVFVADYQRKTQVPEIPRIEPTGKKVAIVGGGPSGLACAQRLVPLGHKVTIFDSKPVPGGLLLYGIPSFKLPNEVFFSKLMQLVNMGVEFINYTEIGREKTIDHLIHEGYDAIYIAVGAGVDAHMNVPGEDLPGVYSGTEFLIRANVNVHYLPVGMTSRPHIGKRVVVIGGGDTASDCLRTALRLGAEEAICIYRRTEEEMPGGKKDRNLALQEGAQFQFLIQPIHFIGENGKLTAIECLRTQLGEPDSSGRRRPVPIEGSEFTIETETAILALGYWPHPIIGETTPGLDTHNYGLITIEPGTMRTSRPEVFAGGDAVNGPDLVVTAMVDGHNAASSIHEFLMH
jgi:glutamate synthase (NADPH/NADH) small chain